MARYILLMSAVMVNATETKSDQHIMSGEWIVGPTSRRSFSDTPVADLAEASKQFEAWWWYFVPCEQRALAGRRPCMEISGD